MDQSPGSSLVHVGIDLSEFYLSVEWDILEVPATRNEEYYPCCPEPFSGKSQESGYIYSSLHYEFPFHLILIHSITRVLLHQFC